MKTLKKVPFELVECEYIPSRENMKENTFYYSKTYKTANHLCPCGCGQQTPLPIKEKEWYITISNNKFSITPSILHRLGCKSHYVISNSIANIL